MTIQEKAMVKEMIENQKRETEYAELRTKTMLSKDLRKTMDEIYVLENGLRSTIEDRKTSITQMQNFLGCVVAIKKNMMDLGLWTE